MHAKPIHKAQALDAHSAMDMPLPKNAFMRISKGKRTPKAAVARKDIHRPPMTVSLNSNGHKSFVVASGDYMVVGIVRWGQEFGVLVIARNGDYLRVNGSHAEWLDPDEVRAAIFKASKGWTNEYGEEEVG